jgi:hypothetical protein
MPCSPSQAAATAAAPEEPPDEGAAVHEDAVGQLVQRLMGLPLLTASQKLAQLHDQQSCTLRQLLELRVDQMRCVAGPKGAAAPAARRIR